MDLVVSSMESYLGADTEIELAETALTGPFQHRRCAPTNVGTWPLCLRVSRGPAEPTRGYAHARFEAAARVVLSTPGAPLFARTTAHARHRTSLRLLPVKWIVEEGITRSCGWRCLIVSAGRYPGHRCHPRPVGV